MTRAAHWPEIARRWAQVGPPLRPSPEDLALLAPLLDRPRRALILGVTPELFHLPWPAGSDVRAMDHTAAMIDAVWPGPRAAAMRADWTRMPLANASRDLVLCDGGFHLLRHPAGQQRLLAELARVVAPGGVCAFRLFTPPAVKERPLAVLRDLLLKRIESLNVLKLRLGWALQRSRAAGVRLGDVWSALHVAAPDFPSLARHVGWTLEHLEAINTYRDSDNRYWFLGVDAVRAAFEAAGFELLWVREASGYALAGRCPTAAFRRSP